MFDFTYVLTIFFLLLGPAKIIPVFARLTQGAEPAYCRRVAVYATLFATAMCVAISLLARTLVASYHLGVPTIQLTGGLILLIWALNAIFASGETAARATSDQSAGQLALSPLATPVIVTPAGVAALMVFVLLAPGTPEGYRIVSSALVLVMALNLLVMYFNTQIVHLRWLLVPLQLLSAVLAVVQVAFALQVILNALQAMGLI
jgi:multiple antibiotic resistance protein